MPTRVAGAVNAGWRDIGGQHCYFRSRWEANYARYLQLLLSVGKISGWEHEPETFVFAGLTRGCTTYLPDFRVYNKDDSIEYHEVKGWMDPKSKTKLKRMKKYHPTVVIVLIDRKRYNAIGKTVRGIIPGWE